MRIDTEDLNAIFQWNLRVDYEAWILHIITSTIVILFIIAVSSVFEKKISPCIKYALWLIAVIKLLVPIPDFESEYHILNLIDNSIIWEKQEDIIKESNITQTDGRTELEKEQEYYEEKFTADKMRKENIQGFGMLSDLLIGGYLSGILVLSGIFLYGNICFQKYIKRNGEYIKTYKNKIPVYKIEEYYGACLYGGFRPVILVGNNEELIIEQQHMILTHEYVHYLHKDHIWSVVRCLCIVLYWYHPLVWAAAFLSRRDGELACDEGTLKRIGKKKRITYGQSLLEIAGKTIDWKKNMPTFFYSTTAAGGRNEMKKRITMIAKGTKTNIPSLMVILILLAGCIGCTSGRPMETLNTEQESNLKTEEGLQNEKEETEVNNTAVVEDTMTETLLETEKEAVLKVSKFIWPTVSTTVSTEYGIRVHPVTGEEKMIDYIGIAGSEGDSVFAVADGKVTNTGFDSILGNYIVLTTKTGEVVTYGHLSGSKVPKEAEVKAGEMVGLMGKTGSATGVFLSISINVNGEMVDPMNYLE